MKNETKLKMYGKYKRLADLDWDLDYDEFLYCECENCGTRYFEEDIEICPVCENDYFINTSKHEGIPCLKCGKEFGTFDMICTEIDTHMYICEDCYNEIEEEGE